MKTFYTGLIVSLNWWRQLFFKILDYLYYSENNNGSYCITYFDLLSTNRTSDHFRPCYIKYVRLLQPEMNKYSCNHAVCAG